MQPSESVSLGIPLAGMESEISKRQAGFIAAFASGNAPAAASFYADDCHFMPHGRETVTGKAGRPRPKHEGGEGRGDEGLQA